MKTLGELFTSTVQTQETSAPSAGQPPKGGIVSMFFPMAVVFVIFYFLMIRPQAKQRKQHQTLLQGLKKGDEIITSSGIYGKIAAIADNIATIEIAENIRIKMDKQQVATVKASS